ncbi:MAG TPA: hypothetical protein VMG12_27370 [Polyangiaceae bacterium]|nr:hypothetical protein [Polyangiaceae bacterium]
MGNPSHRSSFARAARRAGGACLVAGVWLAAAAPEAQADCALPAPSILWSSPAEGADDVALDADLLLVTERYAISYAHVTLLSEGAERVLAAGSALPNHFDLGELEPDRAYTVVIEQDGYTSELHFSTGRGRAVSVSAGGDLLLRSVSRDLPPLSATPEFCNEVQYADTCFDTYPQPGLYAFDVDAAPSPVSADSLWVMQATFVDPEPGVDYGAPFRAWPAVCGTPMDFSFDPSLFEYRIYNIGEGGEVRSSNAVIGEPDPDHRYEPDPEPEPAPAPSPIAASEWQDRGCTLSTSRAAWPSPGWLPVGSALALALLLRRARRRIDA